jgi:hypothetical protein
MKRCPQCEFIYEDDQSLCDMDGVLLVFDSQTLPNVHALAPVEAPLVATTTSRAHWRHRTFPAMAALILASVLSLVYFVSTQRSVPAPAGVSVPSLAVPASQLPTPNEANQIVAPPAASENTPEVTERVREETKPEANKASTSAPAPAKKTTSKTTESKPAEETKKDDSKVGSILKKTGRILKKPFKF